ncbi:MAG: NUDIX domain-containing protein [Planctomycetes bacterium]|nr:NUDIX domain-containing protein [Planctomycetota bacterium]
MTRPSIARLSVRVIVHDRQGSVLLLQRSPSSGEYPEKWEFPGGEFQSGERLDAAILRELREKMGLKIVLKGSFGVCETKRAKPRRVYLVMEAKAEGGPVRLGEDHSNFEWRRPDELNEIAICPPFRRIARRYAQEVAIEPRVRPGKAKRADRGKGLFGDSVVQPESLRDDLDEFKKRQRDYDKLSGWLEAFLREHVRAMFPLADIGVRTKGPASFAAKLIKKNKYKDPLREVTDLVGGRIVVHLQAEVDAVCRWIEETFEIDRANSGDKLKDLGVEKFGYRSIHYVIELRRDKPAEVPAAFEGMKAEIQVRTIAQHAWSDIGHDRVYKADCEVPDYWRREASRIAALLEAADDAFARLVQGVSAFQDHMRQSPDEGSARRAIALWDVVRRELPEEPRPAICAARLAMEISDWDKVVRVVNGYKGEPNVSLLCAKGYALCRKAEHAHAREWKRGIDMLKKAARIGDGSVEPHLRLGQLLAPDRNAEALKHHERAFAIDPSNPTVLVGYIRCKVLEERSTTFIPVLRSEIERAIARSRELAAAGADLPHALYRIAGFHLLMGRTHCHESLDMFALAVHRTRTPDPLVRALVDVSQLAHLEPGRDDIECSRRFLAAALTAKFPKARWPEDVEKPAAERLDVAGPYVIVAGGCDVYHEDAMASYGDLLRAAFADFEGTIISGGTREGISGLVGELAHTSGGRIRALGYLPKSLPTDDTATKDDRYRHRRTDGADEFTAREPIQNWLDLLATDIRPRDVRLLGINGGNIAGLEYRMAVALGATVGVIEGSGREAERVLDDWPAQPPPISDGRDRDLKRAGRAAPAPSPGRLLPLPDDATTLRAFLHMGMAKPEGLGRKAVLQAARLVHEDFLEQQRYRHLDPVMQPWPKLRRDLMESNLNQIEYLVSILRANGFGVRPIDGIPNDPKFTEDEIERMGEMEHGRWNVERLQSGWRHAKKKDPLKRLSPYLIAWSKLDDGTKEWDYSNVRLWPEILAEIGYEVYRLRRATPAAGVGRHARAGGRSRRNRARPRTRGRGERGRAP